MDTNEPALTLTLPPELAERLHRLATEISRLTGTPVDISETLAMAIRLREQRLNNTRNCDIDPILEPTEYRIHWGRVRKLAPVRGGLCALVQGHNCPGDCPLGLWKGVSGSSVRAARAWASKTAQTTGVVVFSFESHRRDRANDLSRINEFARAHGMVVDVRRHDASQRDHALIVVSRPGIMR